jgi:ribose transport system ATP-binding protein
MPHDQAAPAIELRNVQKSYVEGVPVLDGVNLTIPFGGVTALVGANGSGKSTLVRILSGYHAADPGSKVIIAGTDLDHHVAPDTARQAGLRFVHQDSGLVPGVPVIDNMLVGRYRTGVAGHIRWKAERESVRRLLDTWKIEADLDMDAGDLPLATVAKLAVLRALRTDDGEQLRAVVLDEPTAALGKVEATELLQWLRDLAVAQGVGVLFISHRLDEIFDVADQVAVLRGGRIVADGPIADFDHQGLVEQIVGGRVDRFYPDRAEHGVQVRLAARHLSGRQVQDASFELHAGEVLGVTGLPGSGFEEIPYLISDPRTVANGELEIDGQVVDARRGSVRERIRRGVALIPGDRKRKAVVGDLSVRENLTLPRVSDFIYSGFLHHRRETNLAEDLVAEYRIKTEASEIAVSELSGGNQQKVVLAKWLSTKPSVVLIHEPTHGVDVGAKAEIFSLIADGASAGMASLIATVEYDDLAHLCDRVLVFSHGRICADLCGDSLTPDAITAAAFIGSSPQPAA